MFVRIVREDGRQLETHECDRVIYVPESNKLEVESNHGGFFANVELDSGNRVFLMNDNGGTFDSFTVGE